MLTLNTMLPALVVLVLALAGGAWVAFALRRRAPVEPMRDALDDADEKVAKLMAHLRELALQEGRVDGETYARERSELEGRAAQAMRERDELVASSRPASGAAAPAETSSSPFVRFLQQRPAVRGALWATGIFVVGGALFYFVQAGQGTGATGAAAQAAGPDGARQQRVEMPPFITAEMPTQAEVQELMGKLRANPSDVTATVRLGHLLIAGRLYEEARVITDRVLQLDPSNLEARTHDAALRSVQDRQAGLRLLDALLRDHPDFAEAWLFRGMIGLNSGDGALARESFQKYLQVAPEGRERTHVRAMLDALPASSAAANP